MLTSNVFRGTSLSECSECVNRSSGPVVCTGVHMDSSEPFVGGSCYQNNVRGKPNLLCLF